MATRDDMFLIPLDLNIEHDAPRGDDAHVLQRGLVFKSGVAALPDGGDVYVEIDGARVWKLLATFEQPLNKTVNHVAQTLYDRYFNDGRNIWIHGNSEGVPLTTTPLNDGDFHVNSHDWRAFLCPGKSYRLRQQVFKTANRRQMFDVSYTFTYKGATMQDQVTDPAKHATDRAWVLTDRVVHKDTTSIAWDAGEGGVTRFWLPFGEGVSGMVYSASGAFSYEDWSQKYKHMRRRYGCCGIIGSKANGPDGAIAWAPLMDGSAYDIAFVHQASGVYGTSGGLTGPVVLAYWIAEL